MKRIAGVLLVAASLLAPAAARGDTLNLSGRTGVHRHVACVPEWGCRPYRISGTVTANIYRGRGGRAFADAAFGIFYSTAALSPDTILVYGFQYRRKGGPWHRVCVRKLCQFDSLPQASWPGNPAGGQYFEARLRMRRPRSIDEVRLGVIPLKETKLGRWVWFSHYHTFKVRYQVCTCPLPSRAAGVEAPPAESEAPEPAPAPAPAPAHRRRRPHPPRRRHRPRRRRRRRTSAPPTRRTRAWCASAMPAARSTCATATPTATAPTPAS